MRRLAIVIVTFQRQQLLAGLLDSILGLEGSPWRVIVVDNENSPETARIVSEFGARADALWGPTAEEPDAEGGTARAVYDAMETNTGGSGGFSEGVQRGYELGAEWFWLMDDDVQVLPGALGIFDRWSPRADAIQPQRYDCDGGHFYWQYRFWTSLGIYNPLSPARWREGEEFKRCNAICFEGGCFSRRAVEKIGLPDPRFFIYLDDALYGYLLSKVTDVLLVPDYALRRMNEVPNQAIGSVRQLNSTSDLTRYYITRNRGYLARYYQLYGDYHPVGFAVGTLLTFAKELLRILLVDRAHLVPGMKRLFKGWRAQRQIQRDPSWEPMAPLA